MSNPPQVRGLTAEPALGRTELTWTSAGFDPLIDHYRINATRGGRRPSKTQLVGKTVFPRLTHHDVDPAGERWTYTVSAVTDAGDIGRPSEPLTLDSVASVSATGRRLGSLGEFDGKSLEFQHSPAAYAKIPTDHPDGVIELPADAQAADCPYLLPGPGDSWAGRKAYRIRWEVEAEDPSSVCDIALWFVDTTRLGGRLDVIVNGDTALEIEIPKGATLGSRDGDATRHGSLMQRAAIERELPADIIQPGTNIVELVLAEGGWVAWDGFGLYARQ